MVKPQCSYFNLLKTRVEDGVSIYPCSFSTLLVFECLKWYDDCRIMYLLFKIQIYINTYLYFNLKVRKNISPPDTMHKMTNVCNGVLYQATVADWVNCDTKQHVCFVVNSGYWNLLWNLICRTQRPANINTKGLLK